MPFTKCGFKINCRTPNNHDIDMTETSSKENLQIKKLSMYMKNYLRILKTFIYLIINYRRSKSCDDEKYSHATERKSNFVGDKECMVM